MERSFDVLFFDLGGTLRLLYDNAPHQERAVQRIAELVGTDMEPHAFVKLLDERYEVYRKVAFDTCWEATEAELWTRWMTPDYPRDRIIANAVDLSFEYRQVVGERLMAPHSREVVIELHKRGYRLGIISNLITSQEVPDWLRADGLTDYFETVLLSAVIGYRKPDPRMYMKACADMRIAPGRCVSIADNLKRDITGAKAVGMGMNILFGDAETIRGNKPKVTEANRPDAVIFDFLELLDIFPGAPRLNEAALRQIEDA